MTNGKPANMPDQIRHYINGEWVDSIDGDTFDILNPVTNETYIKGSSGKVADVDAATAFWTREVGLELMTGWAGQAAFLAADGYHHHIGANTWFSRGADPEPPEGPGLDAVVLGGTGRSEELRTPDELRVVLEP